MRLQRLKMVGFKSFADSVTIDFDAGITAIVGPNGSGKSNVVDALAWVLGAQSPRMLRLAKMEELIYAGGDGRQPLGRAEVTIEFDNSDHQVTLPMAEIAMSRAISRSGDAQYRLNGVQCRLVDLVDTLSEANLGKTQHVIISQGEIESLANAKGDEIRSVLEDAAQVSSLRRRLQQSERHVESVTASLHEVTVKERELRRRIKPLRSQVALYEQRNELLRRRDAVALWVLRRRLEGYAEQARAAQAALDSVTARLAELEITDGDTEPAASTLEPLLGRLRARRQEVADLRAEVLSAMTPLNELESTIARGDAEQAMVADELTRLSQAKEEITERINQLEREGAMLATMRGELARERRSFEEHVPPRPVELEALVAELRGQRSHLLAVQQRQSLEEERRSRELQTRNERLARTRTRVLNAETELTLRKERLIELERAREDLTNGFGSQTEALDVAERELGELRGRERELGGQLRALRAQVDSLVKLAGANDGTTLGETLLPRDGLAQAVAGVLGELSDAHVYESLADLIAAARMSGRDSFLGYVPDPGDADDASAFLDQAPRWLGNRFRGVRLVDDVLSHLDSSDLEGILVDRNGTVFREGLLRVGASQRSVAKLQLATHQRELAEVVGNHGEIERHYNAQIGVVESLRQDVRAARSRLDALGTEHSQVAARISKLQSELSTLGVEQQFLEEQTETAAEPQLSVEEDLTQIESELASATAQLAERRRQLQNAERERSELERREVSIRLKAGDLAAQLRAAAERLAEFDARKATLEGRLASLAHSEQPPLAQVRALLEELRIVAEALNGLTGNLVPLENKIAQARAEEEMALEQSQRQRQALARERELLTERRLEYATEESRLRSRLLTEEEAAARATGMPLAHIRQAILPEGVAPTAAEALLAELEAQITQVGQVNPLAGLELSELEEELERFRVETTDVRQAHQEAERAFALLEEEMATRITGIVSEVAIEFDRLMERLFRGGTGTVALDDPAQPLTSPMSLDVKIPAKRVRRLGLLSGGERSLVSLAFLFAVLKVRPVPFVVLDEVEAALDDKNLSAFAALIEDVSQDCQVIVVTHQRRTMEVATLLVGISMSPRGSSTVVRHVLADAVSDSKEAGDPKDILVGDEFSEDPSGIDDRSA